MSRSSFLLILGLLLLFFGNNGALFPQSLAGNSAKQAQADSLSLADTWRTLLHNNLSLHQLQEKVAQAEKEVAIQKTSYFPTVSTIASYNYVSELARLDLPFQIPGAQPISIEAGVKNQYDAAIMLKQPLFTGFRTTNLVRAADRQLQSVEFQRQVLSNQLKLQTGLLFFNIQLNKLQQKVLSQGIDRAQVQLQKVRNFYQAKQATQFDTLEVANRKLQMQSQLQNLKNLYEILLSRLRFLLNQNEISPIALPDVENIDLTIASQQDFFNQALQNRPELKQLSAQKEAQQFRVRAVRSALFPQVFASASYHYARPGVNFFRNEWMNYYTVGVNLQWEIWSWKRDWQKVQQASLEVKSAELQNQQQIDRLRQEISEAYQYLQSTKDQIELQRRLVEQERQRYQITEQKYNQGQAALLDLRDAEKNLTAAELQLQKNYIEWFQYGLQLQYAAGLIGSEKSEE